MSDQTTAPTLDVAELILPDGSMVAARVGTDLRVTVTSSSKPNAVEDAVGGDNAGKILTLCKTGTQVWARWEAGRLCLDVRRIDPVGDDVWTPAAIRSDVRLVGAES